MLPTGRALSVPPVPGAVVWCCVVLGMIRDRPVCPVHPRDRRGCTSWSWCGDGVVTVAASRILTRVSATSPPLRVRLRNDYEIVTAGLEAMLAPYSDRIEIVATKVGEDGGEPVAVTLYDTFGLSQADGDEIDDVVRVPTSGKVVVYTWNMQEELVSAALAKGCHGYLSKSIGVLDLVSGLEAIGAGGAGLRVGGALPRHTGHCRGRRGGLAREVRRTHRPGGRGGGADHPGIQQRADREAHLHHHQHAQVLHPVRLPEDGGEEPGAGGPVGDRARC